MYSFLANGRKAFPKIVAAAKQTYAYFQSVPFSKIKHRGM
jgi:hypothetical protein